MANRESRALSTPIIYLDGRRLKIISNSCMAEIPGAMDVRSVSAGGGAVEMVRGFNIEEMKCKVEFELANTAEYAELAMDYAANRIFSDPSTIKIVEDPLQMHYDQMSLVNKPEIPFKPDGTIKFEFHGRFSAIA
jgi:hypothetical protein